MRILYGSHPNCYLPDPHASRNIQHPDSKKHKNELSFIDEPVRTLGIARVSRRDLSLSRLAEISADGPGS
jgi:hypothetical protein